MSLASAGSAPRQTAWLQGTLLATRLHFSAEQSTTVWMIRLTFIGGGTSASLKESFPYYRVTAGVIWTRPELGPIATFAEEGWRNEAGVWEGMRFEGQCRLILGLPRDPVAVSEPLQSVSLSGRVLSASGLPVAVYDTLREHWYGQIAGIFWPAFRIEWAGLRHPGSTTTSTGTGPVPVPPRNS